MSVRRGGRGVGRAAGLAMALAAASALAGPVEVYREGALCPRDRPPAGEPITAVQAIERARALVPERFCGPTRFVSGCEVEADQVHGSWQVYIHQYDDRRGQRDGRALTHTFVVLDPVGNCLANIPGTELGATR